MLTGLPPNPADSNANIDMEERTGSDPYTSRAVLPAIPTSNAARNKTSSSRFILWRSRRKNGDKMSSGNDDGSNPTPVSNLVIEGGRLVLKLVFVGDGAVGKTCFLV